MKCSLILGALLMASASGAAPHVRGRQKGTLGRNARFSCSQKIRAFRPNVPFFQHLGRRLAAARPPALSGDRGRCGRRRALARESAELPSLGALGTHCVPGQDARLARAVAGAAPAAAPAGPRRGGRAGVAAGDHAHPVARAHRAAVRPRTGAGRVSGALSPRGPIKNHRLVAFTEEGVCFRHREQRAAGRAKWRTLTLPVEEFFDRLFEHVPVTGLHMVRAYGLYSGRARAARESCRFQIEPRWRQPPPGPAVPAADAERCPTLWRAVDHRRPGRDPTAVPGR